jgi:hypothetical protein
VLLVLWVVSGLIMLMPVSDVARGSGTVAAPVDWSSVVISPAQAASIAEAAGSGTARVVELKKIRTVVTYAVALVPKGHIFVDATTGKVFAITDTLAAVIAADGVQGGTAAIARIERVNAGGDRFYRGPFPAFHATFNDAARTDAWVSIASGDARRTQASDRLKSDWGHSAHVFTPLARVRGGNRSRLGTLWITSLIALVAMAAGYWLALPARWRARFR